MSPPSVSSLALASLIVGCGGDLKLGSDVLWWTDHETGDLTAWLAAPGGGPHLDDAGSTVAISAAQARSGVYSVELTTRERERDTEGPGLMRRFPDAFPAYYSTWYFLPLASRSIDTWTIQRFDSLAEDDSIDLGLELNLRTLRRGELLLEVFGHDTAILKLPLPDPPPLVPVGRWFHVETFLRPEQNRTGHLSVWLDGRLVYDLDHATTATSPDLVWMVCNMAQRVDPPEPQLFVDDAAISRVRVTPDGVFEYPQ